jgi:hypothetical protein
MNDATSKKIKKSTKKSISTPKQFEQSNSLARCYGEIGISAVAAAARYQGGAKNPAYAPVHTKWHDSGDDDAS